MSIDDTDPTEEELLNRITTGLKRECDRRDISLTPGDAIKIQKYVDLALEEFLEDDSDPPVTMSWFKFGRTTPMGGGGTTLAQPETTVSPGEQQSSLEDFLSMDAEDFEEFYRYGGYEPSLEHANDPLLSFLREYYLSHAPDRFRELYLVNVRLREALQQFRIAADPDSDQQISTEEGEQRYRDVTRLTSQMELLLSDDYVYYPVTAVVPQYLRLIEKAFAGMASLGTDLATYDRFTFALELEEFYNDVAWSKIAHCISRETAKGPGADSLKEESKNELRDFEEKFDTEVENITNECIRVGLFPAPPDFPTRTDETSKTLEELLRVATKPADVDDVDTDQAMDNDLREGTDE